MIKSLSLKKTKKYPLKLIVTLKSKFNVTNAIMPLCLIQVKMLDESIHKVKKPWKLHEVYMLVLNIYLILMNYITVRSRLIFLEILWMKQKLNLKTLSL